MSDPIEQEVAKQMALLELYDRHPNARYRCAETGCEELYERPRIMRPLGADWRCPDHYRPGDPPPF